MDLKLSVVDQSPIHEGRSAAEALHDSVRLAQRCEEFGYHRYWIAEHHNTPSYASPCPEIMVAQIAAATRRIRVGTGGVMLSHYSPYKVAETFRTLAALHGDRIDLGIGRAPGGDELASAALAFPYAPAFAEVYAQQAEQLAGFLTGRLPPQHPYASLRVMPEGGASPMLWMLGSAGGSSALAGQLGMGFVLALFIGTHDRPVAILDSYRRAYRDAGHAGDPQAMLAAAVICADSREEAEFLAASHTYWKVQAFRHGHREALKSPEAALDAKKTLSLSDQAYYDETLASMICGTPEYCRERLEVLADQYAVDELAVVNVTYHFDPRVRSYRLLAGTFGGPGHAWR